MNHSMHEAFQLAVICGIGLACLLFLYFKWLGKDSEKELNRLVKAYDERTSKKDD